MKLKIEGKLRDGFFEWFKKRYYHSWELSWSVFPQSAQFGLLQEYADTLGIIICIEPEFDDDANFSVWVSFYLPKGATDIDEGFLSRPEAQVAAIAQLNKIINDD